MRNRTTIEVGSSSRRQHCSGVARHLQGPSLNPKFARAYTNRGSIEKEIGGCVKAIPDFTKALELERGPAAVYVYRGQCLLELNEPDKALKDFEEAVKLDPGDPDALLALGILKENTRDFKRLRGSSVHSSRLRPTMRQRISIWEYSWEKGLISDAIKELSIT